MGIDQILVSVGLVAVLFGIFIFATNLNKNTEMPEMFKNAPFEACSTCVSDCPHKGEEYTKEGHSHA